MRLIVTTALTFSLLISLTMGKLIEFWNSHLTKLTINWLNWWPSSHPTERLDMMTTDSLGLHRVENKSHVLPAVSLHLYIPPYDSCRVFDQRTGHAMTSNITFYSKGGKKVATISGTSISQDNSKNGLRSGLYKPQVINYEWVVFRSVAVHQLRICLYLCTWNPKRFVAHKTVIH